MDAASGDYDTNDLVPKLIVHRCVGVSVTDLLCSPHIDTDDCKEIRRFCRVLGLPREVQASYVLFLDAVPVVCPKLSALTGTAKLFLFGSEEHFWAGTKQKGPRFRETLHVDRADQLCSPASPR